MSSSSTSASADPRTVKLWISPATCSLAPHIVLRLSGIPFTLKVVTMDAGFTAEMNKVNPKGRVPVLEFPDGTILTETIAIMTWTALSSPDKKLLGETLMQQARCYEWFNWLSGKLHEHGFGGFFNPRMFTDEESAWPTVSKKSRELLDSGFSEIERQVKDGHAVENVFTIIDVFLYVMYRWGYLMEIDMAGKYPNWTELVKTVTAKDEVLEAVRVEGIPLIEDDRLKKAKEAGMETHVSEDLKSQ